VWAGSAVVAAAGLAATVLLVRDTAAHVRRESELYAPPPADRPLLRACSQAGFVNNLNDALAWGLAPLSLAGRGASAREIGAVAAVYPGVWGIGQLGAGWASDRIARTPMIAVGMVVQAGALGLLAASGGAFAGALAAAVVLGAGTALVYPTLLAAVSDAVEPRRRAAAVGRYRFWRDSGLVAGALLAGLVADAVGGRVAIVLVAALTAASGVWVATLRERTELRWQSS
jgi:MFS family permease